MEPKNHWSLDSFAGQIVLQQLRGRRFHVEKYPACMFINFLHDVTLWSTTGSDQWRSLRGPRGLGHRSSRSAVSVAVQPSQVMKPKPLCSLKFLGDSDAEETAGRRVAFFMRRLLLPVESKRIRKINVQVELRYPPHCYVAV